MKKHFLIILFILSLYSCDVDCKKSTDSYRTYDLEVILTKRPYIHGDMKFTGTKLNSNEVTTTRIMGRWFRRYKDYMEIGDTVIKRQGELTMYIHKKDTIMAFKMECQGKIYE